MAQVSTDARVKTLAILVGIAGIFILLRLFQLQVIRGTEFRDLTGTQYSTTRLYGLYDRGSIFTEDRGGRRLTVAGLDYGYTVAINPKQLLDRGATYEALSVLMPELDRVEYDRKSSDSSDPYEELARRVREPVALSIEQLELPGVIVVKERWRSYPGGTFASGVLGFVGWRGDVFAGRYGLENNYEDVLLRKPENIYGNFFTEVFSGIQKGVFGRGVAESGDLVINIEPKVEALVESKVTLLLDTWNAKQAGIVVMEPKTGRILAMAQYPDFNPNQYGEVRDISVFKNSFVEDVFEMGSIMKPITMAAALDAGVVTKNTTYTDRGFVELNEKRIENFDGKGRGVVDMQEVLSQSLNTGVVFVALELGVDEFREYMYKFGFQDKTEIDLPAEASNLVGNLESSKDIEIATASFGQGIAVTPISMIRALAALGNGGYLIKPQIVKAVEHDLGFTEASKVTEQGRAISGKTSEEITRMLVKVVDDALLHGEIKMERYSIAAKTGTAQIASPEGGYYGDRFLHSFFGYFPAYDPKFLVFMYLREPVGVKYASETLARPFKDIAEFLLNYYEVPPDR